MTLQTNFVPNNTALLRKSHDFNSANLHRLNSNSNTYPPRVYSILKSDPSPQNAHTVRAVFAVRNHTQSVLINHLQEAFGKILGKRRQNNEPSTVLYHFCNLYTRLKK